MLSGPQSIAGQALNDAEPRPPCVCRVGVGIRAKCLTRERLGDGNRCNVMLHDRS
jgi:hypothetical protein